MKKHNRWQVIMVAVVMLASLALFASASAQGNTPSPFLGINFDTAEEGVLVTYVLPDSPADEAGLEAGDIITALNGEAVTADELAEAVGALAVGDTVALAVLRDGEALDLEATLAERPQRQLRRRQGPFEVQIETRPYVGVALEETDGTLVIREVSEDSPAAEAGLQVDDVVVSINDTEVSSAQEVIDLIGAMSVGDTVTLNIERDGEPQSIEVTLGETSTRFSGAIPADIIIYTGEGWAVFGLTEGSPLYEAGVRPNDTITAVTIDGEEVTAQELSDVLAEADEDTEATLTISREDETLDITVQASDLNVLDTFGFFGGRGRGRGRGGVEIIPFGQMPFGGSARLGVTFTVVDDDVAAENELDVTEGALITSVQEDSPAATAGLQVGDVVTAVNGEAVNAEQTLRDRLFAYEAGDTITLDVLRDGETLSLEATLEQGGPGFNLGRLPFDFDGRFPRRFFFGPGGRFRFDMPDIPDVPEVTPEAQPNI